MNLIKAATLITFLFMCKLGFADLADPNQPPNCTRMVIRDSKEAETLMNSLNVKAKVEKLDRQHDKIEITTKEVKLGDTTTLVCTSIRQNGNAVHYYTGMRPGCVIAQVQPGTRAESTGGPSADKGARQ